jgi:hypothetical protein
VWLSVRNTTVDLVLYGDAEHSGPGWSGPALGPIPRAHSMVRIGGDSDTSGDWSIEPPGRSSLPCSGERPSWSLSRPRRTLWTGY